MDTEPPNPKPVKKAKPVKGRPRWFKSKHLVDPVLPHVEFVRLVAKQAGLPKEYSASEIRGVVECLVYSIVEAISRGETGDFGGFVKIEHLPVPNYMPGFRVMTITPRFTFPKDKIPKAETLVELDGPLVGGLEKTLTIPELTRRLSVRAGLPLELALELVRTFFRIIKAEMAEKVVLINGFGAFFTQRTCRTIKPPPIAKVAPYRGWIVSRRFQASPEFLRAYRSGLMFPRRYRKPSYWTRRKERAAAAAAESK